MPFAVTTTLALLAALGLTASPLAAGLPQRIADVIVHLNGGIHTGLPLHARPRDW